MSSRINDYRQAVVDTIKAAMPELKSCEPQFGRFDIEALDREMIKTPAVRMAVLSATPSHNADGALAAELKCASFIITSGATRNETAWTMAEAISVLLTPKQMFGILNMGKPEKLNIQPIVSGYAKKRGVAIIAVEWVQRLNAIGEGIFDKDGHVIEELYVNDELLEVDNV